MRYHWGMGIGHAYSWRSPLQLQFVLPEPNDIFQDPGEHDLDDEQDDGLASDRQFSGVEDQAVFCLDDRENEELSGGETSSEEDDDMVGDEDSWIDEL
jgi:hypothetical protein